jgi:hypothetical protein
MSRTVTYTQVVPLVIENYSSDIIALEDSTKVSVQFMGTNLDVDSDMDISIMVSNDGNTWFYDDTLLTNANSLLNQPAMAFKQKETYFKFIKVFIENYAVTSDGTITAIIHIKD